MQWNEAFLWLPGAAEFLTALKVGNNGVINGLTDAQKPHAVSAAAQLGRILYVAANEYAANRALEDMRTYTSLRCALFAAKPFLLVEGTAGQELVHERISVLGSALSGALDVIITSPEALMARLMPPALFLQSCLTLRTGEQHDVLEIAQKLVDMGYSRVPTVVETRGEFALRGGILDVFLIAPVDAIPSYAACRIEFFGDEIDSMRLLDVATQRSIENITEIAVLPAQEILYPQADAQQLIESYRAQKTEEAETLPPNEAQSEEQDWLQSIWPQEEIVHWVDDESETEAFEPLPVDAQAEQERMFALQEEIETHQVGTLEKWANILYPQPVTIEQYFSSALKVLDEPRRMQEGAGNVMLEYQEHFKIQLLRGNAIAEQAELPMDYETVMQTLGPHTLVISALASGMSPYFAGNMLNVSSRSMHDYHGNFNTLSADIAVWKKEGWRVLLFCGGKSRAQRLAEEFYKHEVDVFCPETLRFPLPGEALAYPQTLSKGFLYSQSKLAVVTEQELYGTAHVAPRRRKTPKGTAINTFADLKIGEYVVHESNGIGRFIGVSRETMGGITRDYLKIEYANTEFIYVPIDKIDLVQRYIGSEGGAPKLNKIGGSEWSRTKERVKESVQEMAQELIGLYAKRELLDGFAFPEDTPWQRQLEEDFEYEETPDQLACIAEIKQDMEKKTPMDRLLCGDVGYGKTEVAIRAAMKAVSGGKQVALIAPTTILAQQHHQTFLDRFAGYPITVRCLSRFSTAAEVRDTLTKLKQGLVDILIGTHRILGKDIYFSDLGLLIVDEEQRFGVSHKERIKQMKENIDVLTLTATPIPRTLHMSMTGIRDMSILETPPGNRYEIQTYVMEYEDSFIRDAILHEMARGGQVYFIYNRVASIYRFSEYLRALVPQAKIAVAHGQMNEYRLEDIMLGFVNKEYDVLLCTTIIESGMDIPNTNTLIVYDADRFGLAQLYQLRGRVGRSSRLAYAYLTYRKNKVLSETARKRLSTIMEFTQLGSGFKIAMRDLEIRGAGNLLGNEQHGHIAAVGYDLYCRLIEEAIKKLRGELPKEFVQPQLDIALNAFIPDDYIYSVEQKIEMYKKVAAINNYEELSDVQDEFIDRFGEMPQSVQRLLLAAHLKALCATLAIEHAQYKTPGEMVLRFVENAKINPQALLFALQNEKNVQLLATQPAQLRIVARGSASEPLVHRAVSLLQKAAGYTTG